LEDDDDGIGGEFCKTTHDVVEKTEMCLRYVSEWTVERYSRYVTCRSILRSIRIIEGRKDSTMCFVTRTLRLGEVDVLQPRDDDGVEFATLGLRRNDLLPCLQDFTILTP